MLSKAILLPFLRYPFSLSVHMYVWIYRILFLPLLLVMLPYYLRRMWKRGGYRKDFHHRLGWLEHIPLKPPGVRRIWIQAVSVGELSAIGPLTAALARLPNIEIIVSSTTSTGYELARRIYSSYSSPVYTAIFPLDFWPCSCAAWRRLQPDLVVLTETELWPEHCYQAWRRETSIVLVNGRLSDRSFRRYRLISGMIRSLLQKLTLAAVATEQDKARFRMLGLDADRIVTCGNLKFDNEPPLPLSPAAATHLRRELGFYARGTVQPLIILGASTWPGEEALLLAAFEDALMAGIDARLLIVPRHAERRQELIALLERQPHPWHLRSSGSIPPNPVMIHAVDTTGELSRLTQVADIAFIGKSMPPNDGGQTPLEAAACAIAVLYGPNMSNFRDICCSLQNAGGAQCIDTPENLSPQLLKLLRDPQRRQVMGHAARECHQRNRGATQRTLDVLQPLLSH